MRKRTIARQLLTIYIYHCVINSFCHDRARRAPHAGLDAISRAVWYKDTFIILRLPRVKRSEGRTFASRDSDARVIAAF